MKVLALDFDGVIGDTIWDAFFTAYNVYLKFNPESKLLGGRQLIFDNFIKTQVGNKELCEKFRKLSTFATGGKYFVVIFYIIDRKEEVRNQLEFDVYCSNFAESTLSSFQDEFYVERKRLKSIDIEKWYELSPPFTGVIPEIRKLLEKENVFIVTNKDKDSLIKLGEKYGLKIDADKIIDKEFGLKKSDKLKSLSEKNNLQKEDIILVDDLLPHLLDVKQAGFNCFMAAWGYSTEEQRKVAEQNGIPLLTKENFYYTISGELEK